MEILRALVLGVVQGVTEFLPVSSSGHLVVVRRLFGWTDEGLAFDAALHLGTLIAVLWAFRATWLSIVRGKDWRLLGLLVLATIPGALAGFFGEPLIAARFRGLAPIGVAFLVTALVLLLADRWSARHPISYKLSAISSLWIGLAQVLALLPGLSRSGVTMAAGILLGLPRARAVEFAFLLALPITAAAGAEGIRQVVTLAPQQLLAALVGMVAAAITGALAIQGFLRVVTRRSFTPYIVYLALVGVFVLFWNR